MLTLNVIQDGMTESGKSLTMGMVVEYDGHIPSGMVRIIMPDSSTDIAHPRYFAELQ